MYPRRPGLHLLIHPVTAPLAVDDADAFADGVEDEVRLLGDQRPLKGKKISRVGKNSGKVVSAEGLDGLVNRGHLHHLAVAAKCFDEWPVRTGHAGEHEDFVSRLLQNSPAFSETAELTL